MTLSQVAVRIALSRVALGNLETTGRNRGPLPDGYARGVGLDPERGAYAWCTSGMHDVFREAAAEVGSPNPFPRTAKAVRVFELLQRFAVPDPAPGRLYVLDHGRPGDLAAQWRSGHYTDDGHLGICSRLADDGRPWEVSGNTFSAKGGREGNCWAEHLGFPEVTHGGICLAWIDVDAALAALA